MSLFKRTPQEPAAPQTTKKGGMSRRKFLMWSGAGLTVLAAGGLGVPALMFSRPDMDPDFDSVEPPAGGSYVVAIASEMLRRELKRGWAPSAVVSTDRIAVNKRGFQIGILKGCEGTVQVLRDQVARLRGTSEDDPDLKDAFRRLSYPEDQWSLFFKANSTYSQIEYGINSLNRYNARLGNGKAIYDKRTDSLVKYFERDGLDFGAYETRLSEMALKKGGLSLDAQQTYYQGRGLLFANYVLYKGIRKDFAEIIKTFNIGHLFDKTMDVMEEISGQWGMPRIVLNDEPGGVFASHLQTLAGGLTRVRQAIKEVADAVADTPGRAMLQEGPHFADANKKALPKNLTLG